MNFDYTIIIPHKNTPELLKKCLDSIPDRDDVMTIVVDDNSSPDIVDFTNFPGLNKKNTRVVFDKSGKGAGNARNVALELVENSKWLIFSDADDFFTDYLPVAMDKYRNCDVDEVYFKRHSVYVNTNKPATRHQRANNRLDKVIANNDYEYLLFKDLAPVCKFIKYEIVKNNNIRFESIKYGNDSMFFLDFAIHANKVMADNHAIYVVTESENSLTSAFNKEATQCRYDAAIRILHKEIQYGYGKYHPNLFSFCYRSYKASFMLSVLYFFRGIKNTPIKYLFADLKSCLKSI